MASGDLELSVTDAVPPAGMTEEDTKITLRGHVTADGFTIDGTDSSGKVKEIDFVRASQEQVNAGVDAIPGGS